MRKAMLVASAIFYLLATALLGFSLRDAARWMAEPSDAMFLLGLGTTATAFAVWVAVGAYITSTVLAKWKLARTLRKREQDEPLVPPASPSPPDAA